MASVSAPALIDIGIGIADGIGNDIGWASAIGIDYRSVGICNRQSPRPSASAVGNRRQVEYSAGMQWLLIAIMALTVVGGCSDDGELIQRVSDASITLDTSGCPVQVTAEIHASIGACNEVRPPVVERSDTQVRVRLETVSTADFCIALIAGHEEVVDLGTFGPGDYELVIEAKFDDYRTRFRVDDMCKR